MTARIDTGEPFLKHLQTYKTAYVFVTAETEEFDQDVLTAWRDEGFHTTYVAMNEGGKGYIQRLKDLADKVTGLSDQYAIVAYGDAASACLEGFVKSTPRLAALIGYYPTRIPDPTQTRYSMHTSVLVHLVGHEIRVSRIPEVLGIQGKIKIVTKRIGNGVGLGGQLKLSFPSYKYENVQAGFAEADVDEYDAAAASVAWSRSLGVVRKAFRLAPEVERVRDEHSDHVNKSNISKAIGITDESDPQILYAPTLTGGFHPEDLTDFYTEFFSPSPSSLNAKLLSRTVGTDRVVDEISLSFNHNKAINWLLPCIPPTNRRIEVVLCSVVCIRAGKLYSEHVYWDQASVLMQAGLLDPSLVPDKFKQLGVDKLPVIGAESARAAVRGSSRRINELIKDW